MEPDPPKLQKQFFFQIFFLMTSAMDNHFDGEDLTPVSAAEIRGFNAFSVSHEAYAGIATAVFWPIILSELSSQEAFERTNHLIKCDTSKAFVCDVQIFGGFIGTSSLVLIAGSLSVFLQFLVFISLGSLGDHGRRRKQYMVGFATLTGIIGMCSLFITSSKLWWLAYIISGLATITFGTSFVFNYAWLPVLTRYSAEVIKAREDPDVGDEEYYLVTEKVGNHLSTRSFFYGYMASLAQIIIAIAFAQFVPSKKIAELVGYEELSSTYNLQVCIAAICAFMVFVVLFYTNRLMKGIFF
jgi:MFS-type transporter involved in bile tolerance (Atg22 family)